MEREGEEIRITDALGNKYNYQDIMANYDGSISSFVEDFYGDDT
jgi:hypothetical protein